MATRRSTAITSAIVPMRHHFTTFPANGPDDGSPCDYSAATWTGSLTPVPSVPIDDVGEWFSPYETSSIGTIEVAWRTGGSSPGPWQFDAVSIDFIGPETVVFPTGRPFTHLRLIDYFNVNGIPSFDWWLGAINGRPQVIGQNYAAWNMHARHVFYEVGWGREVIAGKMRGTTPGWSGYGCFQPAVVDKPVGPGSVRSGRIWGLPGGTIFIGGGASAIGFAGFQTATRILDIFGVVKQAPGTPNPW